MTIAPKMKKILDEKHVGYQILQHSLAYTAMETAGAQHIPGKQLIKSVIVNVDGKFVMCVLPSTHLINFDKLKNLLYANEVFLATETEVEMLFPDFDVGAEPPFGELYGLEVYLDRSVSENDDVVFSAGTHTDTIKMKFEDFAHISKAKVAQFADHMV
jgi:Ala-tRNA(Pro) deacylase